MSILEDQPRLHGKFENASLVAFVLGSASPETTRAIAQAAADDAELAGAIEVLRWVAGELASQRTDPDKCAEEAGGAAQKQLGITDSRAETTVVLEERMGTGTDHPRCWVDAGCNQIMFAAEEYFRETARQARKCAELRIADLLGRMAERFEAATAAIWQKRREGDLEAVYTHNMGRLGKAPLRCRDGIVWQVFENRAGYVTNDVHGDPHYRQDLVETVAELAVPIVVPNGLQLGVLNLESRQPQAFCPTDLEELQAAAATLVPPLLVLCGLDADEQDRLCWNPEIHMWSLEAFCRGLCRVIGRQVGGDGAFCTIWYADWEKEDLFVYATSGYDYEFESDQTLPLSGSFTGRVVRCPPGEVVAIEPENDPDFREKRKASILGIRQVVSTPIYVGTPGQPPVSIAALSICLTDERWNTEELREAIKVIAKVLGNVIRNFERQRQSMALAELNCVLRQYSTSPVSAVEGVRDLLLKVFQAEGCSIFVRRHEETILRCVATSGLLTGGSRRASRVEAVALDNRVVQDLDRGPAVSLRAMEGTLGKGEASYDLLREPGFTSYLGKRPGVVIRKNNVRKSNEPGLPLDFPVAPLLKYRESFAPSGSDHRRFLGIGVENRGDLLGVVRILRPASSRPYTMCDARLLARVGEAMKKPMLDARRDPLLISEGFHRDGESPSRLGSPRSTTAAMVRMFCRPIPTIRSAHGLASELVVDLCTLLGEGVLQASILVQRRSLQADRFGLYAYYSDYHKTAPVGMDDDPLWMLPSGFSVSQFLAKQQVLTFCDENSRGMSGIRIPISAWSDRVGVQAILAVDFCRRRIDSDNVLLAFYAACRLAAIWGSTDSLGESLSAISPDIDQLDVPTALQRLALSVYDPDGISLMIPSIVSLQSYSSLHLSDSRFDEAKGQELTSEGIDADLVRFGVRCDRSRTQWLWSVPLRYGPTSVGEYRFLFGRHRDTSAVKQVVGQVTELWSALALARRDLWSITPSSGSPSGPSDVRFWDFDVCAPEIANASSGVNSAGPFSLLTHLN